MSVRHELEKIYDKHGYLTAEIVVAELSSPEHPLHGYLTWDDKRAAEQWRLEQAASLIRSVQIERVDPSDPKIRQYLSVQVPPEQNRVYERTDKIASDPVLRQIMLKSMERDWKALQAKYGHFQEFAEMVLGSISEPVSA
jgi:hypothetical protein